MTMPIALIIFILGFIGGQVVSVPLGAGVRMTLLDISVVCILLFGAYHVRKQWSIPSLWAPVMGFLGVALVSLLGTIGTVPPYVMGGGLLYILRWITYAALYWVAASPMIAPSMWLLSLVVSGVVLASAGLFQYIWYPDLRNLMYLGWDPHYKRVFSTLLDPNFAGILLAATILILISMWKKGKAQYALYASICVSLTALILTYSRSSFIAFAAGLCVWGLLQRKKTIVFAIVVVMAGLVLLLPRTGEGQNIFRTVSSFARVGNAQRAISLIREKPILGHGFNILRFVSLEHSWIDETESPSLSGAGLDTSVLFVGATTGFAGIAVYGWLIVSLLRRAFKAYNRTKKPKPFFAAYIAVLTAFVIHSIFINSLFYPWVMAWMWILTGVLEQSVRADT